MGKPAPLHAAAVSPAADGDLRHLIERFDASVLDAPAAPARVRLCIHDGARWDALLGGPRLRLEAVAADLEPDAELRADRATWHEMGEDLGAGLAAFRSGRLLARRNLHLAVSFLAATSGARSRDRLRFRRVDTASGQLSILTAGSGEPVVLVHGLGATKISFLTTAAALAGTHRVISVDLPGFGDSAKPLLAGYHPPFFARAIVDLLDALGIERAHVIGNSMGGRTALELGIRHPDRVRRLVLVAPSLAWRRERPWAPFVRLLRPELGLVQVTPRWAIEAVVQRIIPEASSGWVRAGVDEFLRAYLTPRGRVALYAAARQIYLEEPHGVKGFWTRLRDLAAPTLFVWGRQDRLVPLAFAAHVKEALPSSRHLELDCGHVPQLERPQAMHAAVAAFLGEARSAETGQTAEGGAPTRGG